MLEAIENSLLQDDGHYGAPTWRDNPDLEDELYEQRLDSQRD